MILSDSKILEELKKGNIAISGFDEKRLNPNSYNLRLSNTLKIYKDKCLDPKKKLETETIIIPEDGYVLQPGVLYLGSTVEWISSVPDGTIVPMVEGRSSIGRLGLSVHVTAGFCDIGFKGNITLELFAIHPVKIYPNMEICQIYYERTEGKCLHPYNGKYQGQTDPVESRLGQEYGLKNDRKYNSNIDLEPLTKEDKLRYIVKDSTIPLNDTVRYAIWKLLIGIDPTIDKVPVSYIKIVDTFCQILRDKISNSKYTIKDAISDTMKKLAMNEIHSLLNQFNASEDDTLFNIFLGLDKIKPQRPENINNDTNNSETVTGKEKINKVTPSFFLEDDIFKFGIPGFLDYFDTNDISQLIEISQRPKSIHNTTDNHKNPSAKGRLEKYLKDNWKKTDNELKSLLDMIKHIVDVQHKHYYDKSISKDDLYKTILMYIKADIADEDYSFDNDDVIWLILDSVHSAL